MESRIINPWTWQEEYGFQQGREVTGAERTLYLAGQASVDDDGEIVHSGDMAGQIAKSLDNLEAVLNQADMTFANIVRLNVYTVDVDALLENAAVMERVNEGGALYAGTLLGVARLALPGLLVELEATAVA